MLSVLSVLLITLTAIFPFRTYANEAVDNEKITTAVIHYKQTNSENKQLSDLIIYVDNEKKAVETINLKGEKERLEFFDGKNSYQVFLLDNIAVKLDNPEALLNMYYFRKELDGQYFVKKEQFLKKECKVYYVNGSTYYFWHDLLLKRIFKMSFTLITEATNIELNVPMPQDKFTLPTGIKVVSFSEAMPIILKRQVDEVKSGY
ncbi:MAG: hypothetical protein Q8N14_00490 [Candidatus Omnitrophota bacterium]|nr:hypothetical protein [Candidatus Omnitrophota bacterium]